MIRHSFPSCCGAMNLSGFDYDSDKQSLEKLSNDLANQTEIQDKHGYAFFNAILNGPQRKHFGSILVKHGFKMARRGLGTHREDIYLYVRINPKTTKKGK